MLLVIRDGPTEAAADEQGIGPMNTFQTTCQATCDILVQAPVDLSGIAFPVTRLPIIAAGARTACTHAARAHGLALAFAQDDDAAEGAEPAFALLIVDAAGAEIQRLGPFGEEDVVAVWRDVAARAGLVRMIVREDGVVAPVGQQLGRVSLGRTRMRRRHGSLGARRPRFLARRKTGRLPARPQIHRGESEIIARH